MGICNDECDCLVDAVADSGIIVDGLGSVDAPYEIGVDTGFLIPRVGTAAERALLDPTTVPAGTHFFETDTAQEYVAVGIPHAWVAVTVAWIQSVDGSDTLTAGIGVEQTVATVVLSVGYWFLHAKGNIEASVDTTPVIWTASLFDSTDALLLDETHTSGTFENPLSPTDSFARAFALGTMFHAATTPTTVVLRIHRDNVDGSQLIINPLLTALRIPGV